MPNLFDPEVQAMAAFVRQGEVDALYAQIQELQRQLAQEQTGRAVNRCHVHALEGVLRELAASNPDIVRQAIERAFTPMFLKRAGELGLASMAHDGSVGVARTAERMKGLSSQDCLS